MGFFLVLSLGFGLLSCGYCGARSSTLCSIRVAGVSHVAMPLAHASWSLQGDASAFAALEQLPGKGETYRPVSKS